MIDFVQLFRGIPPQISTLLIAMTPIGELRAALPIALGVYHLPLFSAFFWSVLGNTLPVVFLLLFLGPLSEFFMKKSAAMNRFFRWLFRRTQKKAMKDFMKYGQWALVIFVAIPLPITGAWTGSVAAFLFKIPFWGALLLNFLGILGAGLIVALISTGAFSFLDFLISR